MSGSYANGSYTLLSYTGTQVALTDFQFSGGGQTMTVGSQLFTLTQTGDNLILTIGGTSASIAYWKGGTDNSWATGPGANFVTGTTSVTTIGVAPSSATDVYFSANSPTTPINTTLDGSYEIHSLNFGAGDHASSAVSIAQGTTGTLTVDGGGITAASGAGNATISAPLAVGATQSWVNGSASTLAISGNVTGAGNVAVQNNSTGGTTISGTSFNPTGSFTNSGSGAGTTTVSATIGSNVNGVTQNSSTSALVLTGNNTYSGNTTITSGKLYASNNGVGSATSTGTVTVANGGTLAGSGRVAGPVNVQSGGTVASGSAQTGGTGSSTVDGTHLTLTSDLNVAGGGNLTFALGAGATTGADNFANPNLNSTYLIANGAVNFATSGGAINFNLIDLTASTPSNDTLALRYQNPYLLVSATSNLSFNLVTTGGFDQNGVVLGIGSAGTGNTVLNSLNLTMYDANGVDITATANYTHLQLYLYNGQLEIVPEPGTWALMLAGLGVLVFWQRRKMKG